MSGWESVASATDTAAHMCDVRGLELGEALGDALGEVLGDELGEA